MSPTPDSQELEQFREKWRAEVQRKLTGAWSDVPDSQAEVDSPAPSTSLTGALIIYRSAVEHERLGQLDDALRLYRIAFRKDPNVDKLYHREEVILAVTKPKRHLEHVPPEEIPVAVPIARRTLANVVAGFPDDLAFDPEIEEEKVILNDLPPEILIKILMNLNPTALERFGSVSRKARVFTLDTLLWREFVHTTYKPPQIPDQDTLDAVIERSLYDYRRVYVEQPRVRTDGVYISVCHYVRPGLSENHWVNVNHLIVYHRYLRFYTNGHVISLRTHEAPAEAIPHVHPKSRMQGLFFGRWTLQGNAVLITNLVEVVDHVLPLSLDSDITEVLCSNPSLIRYLFTMSLTLRSRPLGRWNRLDITAFDSVQVESGDVAPVMTKDERPFWFSKVRSY